MGSSWSSLTRWDSIPNRYRRNATSESNFYYECRREGTDGGSDDTNERFKSGGSATAKDQASESGTCLPLMSVSHPHTKESLSVSVCAQHSRENTDDAYHEGFQRGVSTGSLDHALGPTDLMEFKPDNEVERSLSYSQSSERRKCMDVREDDADKRLEDGLPNEKIEVSRSATELHLISDSQPDPMMQSSSISICKEKGSFADPYRRISTDGDGYESFHSVGSTDLTIHVPLVRDSECGNEVMTPYSYTQTHRRSSSFALVDDEWYIGDMNGDIQPEFLELAGLTIQESRAWERMIILTNSELEMLITHLNISVAKNAKDSKVAMVREVLEWRRRRGDFGALVSCADVVEGVLLEIFDMQALPWDAQIWTKEMLLSFPRPDLQLECLLRAIEYDAEDTKTQLIEKLMFYRSQGSSICSNNTFQILEEQSKDEA